MFKYSNYNLTVPNLKSRKIEPKTLRDKGLSVNFLEFQLASLREKQNPIHVNELVCQSFRLIQDELNGFRKLTYFDNIDELKVRLFLRVFPKITNCISTICYHRKSIISFNFTRTALKFYNILISENIELEKKRTRVVAFVNLRGNNFENKTDAVEIEQRDDTKKYSYDVILEDDENQLIEKEKNQIDGI